MFKQQWDHFKLASELGTKSQEVQAATFMCLAGLEAQELSNTFVFTAAESKNNVDDLVAKFEAYCNPRKNTTYERFVFVFY